MATYNQVSYGSKGDDVSELQKLLNQNGYNLKTDGIFGKNTQAAVRDYQQKNGLAVDGIVGKNTWGKLTGGTTASTSSTTPTKTPSAADEALNLWKQQQANAPGAFQFANQQQMTDLYNKIMNREDFSFDLNGDALYQQYKDKYIQQGKMAMMDTMGQAQAATGGYGSSYAQSVSQQAYQGHLQQLNDVVPELYQMAYDRYNQEGQDLYNQYALLDNQYNREYGIHRDKVSDHNAKLDQLWKQYESQYQIERDKVEDEWKQKEFDEAVRQFNVVNKIDDSTGTEQSFHTPNNPQGTANKTSSGMSYDNEGLTESQVKELQAALGMSNQDGFYADATKKAAGNMSAREAYAKYVASNKGTSFKGTTLAEALTFLKQQGVANAYIQEIMSASDWKTHKDNGSQLDEVTEFSTYQDYLKAFVQYAIDNAYGVIREKAEEEK